MLRSGSGFEHSRLMPPAISRSAAEWPTFSALHQHSNTVYHQHQHFQQAPENHVLLTSAALLTPPPQLTQNNSDSIMPYEDGTELNYFSRSYTSCADILEYNSFDDHSFLTSSREVLQDYNNDMSLWSTASNKKITLEVPDCWAAKPVRLWSEDDVAEWLTTLGVSHERMAEVKFRITGLDLATHGLNRNYITSIENEFNVEIYESLQGYLELETPTTEHNPSLPAFNALREQDIKQEESSQSDYPHNWDQYQNRHESHFKNDDEYSTESESERNAVAVTRVPRSGRRGRPPSATSKLAKRKLEKRHGRLWEFIRDLLKNPEYCPSLICWENHDEGVFRFVSSEKVAQLWGSKRGNTKMTYEKLSRAMRYYYKSKILQPVTHRRLVYKFGPGAKNWRHPNPNFRRPV